MTETSSDSTDKQRPTKRKVKPRSKTNLTRSPRNRKDQSIVTTTSIQNSQLRAVFNPRIVKLRNLTYSELSGSILRAEYRVAYHIITVLRFFLFQKDMELDCWPVYSYLRTSITPEYDTALEKEMVRDEPETKSKYHPGANADVNYIYEWMHSPSYINTSKGALSVRHRSIQSPNLQSLILLPTQYADNADNLIFKAHGLGVNECRLRNLVIDENDSSVLTGFLAYINIDQFNDLIESQLDGMFRSLSGHTVLEFMQLLRKSQHSLWI